MSFSAASRPLVSAEDYTRFQERTRRRRVDKRLDAARQALSSNRSREAAAAVEELMELDPNLPELQALKTQLADTQKKLKSTQAELAKEREQVSPVPMPPPAAGSQ